MTTFLSYAFAGFWHFIGALCLFTVGATLAANVAWRVVYFLTVMVRGWPEGTKNVKLNDIEP